ncbi:hypothetical protein RB595_002632 [Gaeumannomyces hyphopodioides]
MERATRDGHSGQQVRESYVSEPALDATEEPRQKRHANVYDAVAGRVTTTGNLGASSGVRSVDGVYRLRDATLAPEDVLFQRVDAPQRYAEKDVYFSREAAAVTESDSRLLPDSDLLKAVHSYAANLFEAVGSRRGAHGGSGHGDEGQGEDRDPDCFVGPRHVDERSMDETALIAFGILLEEAGREVLGRRGDLVFTEGLDEEGPAQTGRVADGDGRQPHMREVSVGPSDGETFWRRDYKRRKRNDGGFGES